MTRVRRRAAQVDQEIPPVVPLASQKIFSHGVDPDEGRVALHSSLRFMQDDPSQPFCTCVQKTVGFGFDPSIGVYLHADPACWRPSRSYYEAAVRAGVIVPSITKEH